MLDLVIFSKDRACQLELLLRSIKRFVDGWEAMRIAVLHTYSAPEFGRGYELARGLHPEFEWVCELDSPASFRDLTLAQLGRGDHTAFLVDDNVFKTPFSVDAPQMRALAEDPELLCLSLRMAPRMNYCYALDQLTPIPAFERETVWSWRGEQGDWGYPMSLDGHVFRTVEIVALMERLAFHNPNSLEAVLAAHPLARPKAICLPEPAIINLPINRVQDTALNRHGDVAAEWLNERFLAGGRLALETVIAVRNPGPHHEVDLRWEPLAETPAGDRAPRVSVVVPCFNHGAYLEEAVETVLAQDFDDLEVLIVNDGSTDGSGAAADALAARHVRVRVIHQDASGHPAHSRNAGIDQARGEYVLCLDADDRLDDPRFLGACVNALDVRPAAGVAFADQRDFGGAERVHAVPDYDFRALTRANRLSVCSLFRRAAWAEIGGYAEVGYEDWDFWVALGERGWHGVKVPGVTWSYRVAGTGRFAADQASDLRIKASMVERRPGLYTAAQREWAEGVLRDDPAALAVPHAPGRIPEDPVFVAAQPMPAQELRSFVTVALADEVIDEPSLLTRYAGAVGADDDATLLLYAPDADSDAVVPRLTPALAAAGMDGEGGPDIVLVAVPASEGDPAVRRFAHAALSNAPVRRAPLDGLPLFGDGEADAAEPEVEPEPELEVPADMAWTYQDGQHYERNVATWFERLLERRDDPVVYDIGANYGFFSSMAARRAGAVYAFEPTAETYAVLRRNLARRGVAEDHALNMALSDLPGTARIHRYSSSGNNSLFERSLPPGHPLRLVGEEEVSVDTLDAVVERLELAPPDVIKLDVEGAELPVLRGGERTLRRHRPDILLEWGETTSRDAGYPREDIADALEAMGYTLFGLAEDPHDLRLRERARFGEAEIGTLLATADPDRLRDPAPTAPAISIAPPAPAPAPVPAVVAHRPPGWDWYVDDLTRYRALGGEVADTDLNPQLNDKTPDNPYDQHYFFQDVWAARRVADMGPTEHVDVGSRVDYVGFLTAICDVVFVDIRPLPVEIENFRCVVGSILDMPFPDRSLVSVSCLHVAEHIGLGRYGDPLDPEGTVKAAAELQRVIAPGGQLLFSGPVGRKRTCFNAHRVHDPLEVLGWFSELELVEFSGVDDRGRFQRFREPADLLGSSYACGMYRFVRPLDS